MLKVSKYNKRFLSHFGRQKQKKKHFGMFSGHEKRNFQITKKINLSGVKPNTNLHAAFEVSTTKIVACSARTEKKKQFQNILSCVKGLIFKLQKYLQSRNQPISKWSLNATFQVSTTKRVINRHKIQELKIFLT